MGRCHLDGFSSGCWSGASQAMKKATASSSLSDPTTRPLYQGADNAGRMKSWRVACKWSYKVWVWASPRESLPFSYSVKIEWFHAPIHSCCGFSHCFCGRLTWLVIVLVPSLQKYRPRGNILKKKTSVKVPQESNPGPLRGKWVSLPLCQCFFLSKD